MPNWGQGRGSISSQNETRGTHLEGPLSLPTAQGAAGWDWVGEIWPRGGGTPPLLVCGGLFVEVSEAIPWSRRPGPAPTPTPGAGRTQRNCSCILSGAALE